MAAAVLLGNVQSPDAIFGTLQVQSQNRQFFRNKSAYVEEELSPLRLASGLQYFLAFLALPLFLVGALFQSAGVVYPIAAIMNERRLLYWCIAKLGIFGSCYKHYLARGLESSSSDERISAARALHTLGRSGAYFLPLLLKISVRTHFSGGFPSKEARNNFEHLLVSYLLANRELTKRAILALTRSDCAEIRALGTRLLKVKREYSPRDIALLNRLLSDSSETVRDEVARKLLTCKRAAKACIPQMLRSLRVFHSNVKKSITWDESKFTKPERESGAKLLFWALLSMEEDSLPYFHEMIELMTNWAECEISQCGDRNRLRIVWLPFDETVAAYLSRNLASGSPIPVHLLESFNSLLGSGNEHARLHALYQLSRLHQENKLSFCEEAHDALRNLCAELQFNCFLDNASFVQYELVRHLGKILEGSI